MTQASSEKQLLLIGASRGLGLALAAEHLSRGWRVVATERAGRPSGLGDLAARAGGRLEIAQVDIDEPGQVAALRAQFVGRRFDLLFVNPGVGNVGDAPIGEVETSEFVRVMVTNALSPLRVVEALQDLVQPAGTIAVMSSGQGSVANNLTGGHEVYRASKAALNTLMRSFAARQGADGRTLLLLAPGWVRTDLGGPNARLTIEDSIPNLVNVLEAQAGKPGLQYLDYLGKPVSW